MEVKNYYYGRDWNLKVTGESVPTSHIALDVKIYSSSRRDEQELIPVPLTGSLSSNLTEIPVNVSGIFP